jgi:hypothetical protein
MSTNTHSELISSEIHRPYRQIFADATERLADATVYEATDLYKKAYQVDTSVEYTLTSYSPTIWTVVVAADPSTEWDLTAGVLSNNGSLSTQATDDFVVGSSSLDDTGVVAEDNRLLFDKSKAAFRAGSVTSTEWDDVNRGSFSTAFGINNTSAADNATVAGGSGNNIVAASDHAFIGGGLTNSIDGFTNGTSNGILAGQANTIGDGITLSATNAIICGLLNNIDGFATANLIGGGASNKIGDGTSQAIGNTIVGGSSNLIDGGSFYSVICGGGVASNGNEILNASSYCFIGGGQGNQIGTVAVAGSSVIIGGSNNLIDQGTTNTIAGGNANSIIGVGFLSSIGGGNDNTIDTSEYSVIAGGGGGIGNGNTIDTSDHSFIGGGEGNLINGIASDAWNVLCGGASNNIGENTNSVRYNFIGGGTGNDILDGDFNLIVGGQNNSVSGVDYAIALGGNGTDVTASYAMAFGNAVDGKYHGALSFGGSSISTQSNIVHWGDASTSIGPWELYLDGTGEQYVLADNQRVGFCIWVIGARESVAEQAMYKFEGLAERGTGAGSTSLLAVNKTVIHEDVAALDVVLDIDAFTGAIRLSAWGITAQTWNWSATGIMMDATG